MKTFHALQRAANTIQMPGLLALWLAHKGSTFLAQLLGRRPAIGPPARGRGSGRKGHPLRPALVLELLESPPIPPCMPATRGKCPSAYLHTYLSVIGLSCLPQ